MRPLVPLWVVLGSSCAALLPAPSPMTALRDVQPAAKCLVVLLPGAGDSAADFEGHGFVQAIRSHGLSADVVSAEATLGYYLKGQLVERLATDVVLPAQRSGYQQTWLIGMSMGGLGTLLYSHEHPQVSGVLALAPYLGDAGLIEEIRAAGGLWKWSAPQKAALQSQTYQRELWRWLQAVTTGAEPGPALYLGWGREDRLGPAAALLAQALPADHVFTVEGGHHWGPWKEVLEAFLSDSEFTRACGR